jgi:hypothetical protein
MVIDFGGAVIPWYEGIPIGATNVTLQPRPANPSREELQLYFNGLRAQQDKMREGNGWFNDFVGNLEPLKIAAMAAATISGNAYLIPYIAGADTAIKGGDLEDVIKSAATAYVGQQLGTAIGGGTEGFTGASETGLATLAGEDIAQDVLGATLLNEVGSTGLDTAINTIPIDQAVLTPDFVPPDVLTADDLYTGQAMTDLASTSDTTKLADLVRAYETPTELTPTYDFSPEVPIEPVSPEFDPTSYIPETTPTYDFSPQVPVEQVSPELDPTGSLQTPEPTPYYDFSPETPIEQVSPELDTTGTLSDSLNPTLKDVYKTLKTANTVRKILTPQEQLAQTLKTPLQTAQASQQQTNLANVLRGTQLPQTALPAIYKQANPFNFGQQNQPVQDTNALAKLLRTA